MKKEKLEKQASSEIAQSRERFENWGKEVYVDKLLSADRQLSRKQIAWDAWQAAERDTRERCAQIADEWLDLFYSLSSHELAERIRGKE